MCNNLKLDIFKVLFLFLLFIFAFPTPTHARSTTYIGNYEVTTEDNGTKKEVVRVAGSMGKVVKSRNILGNNTPSKWDYAYYTTDAQGSTRQEIRESNLTNPPTGGQIPKPNTYYAYGTPVILSGSEGSRLLNAQTQKLEDTYTGQKKDEETGLMYYNARYYNPQTGIFLQADSVNDGQNKYQYVAGNPVNNVDPSGNVGGSNAGADCMCGGSRNENPGLYSAISLSQEDGTQMVKDVGTVVVVGAAATATLGAAEALPVAVAGVKTLALKGMVYAQVTIAASPMLSKIITKTATVLKVFDTVSTTYECLTGKPTCAMSFMTTPSGLSNKDFNSPGSFGSHYEFGQESVGSPVDLDALVKKPDGIISWSNLQFIKRVRNVGSLREYETLRSEYITSVYEDLRSNNWKVLDTPPPGVEGVWGSVDYNARTLYVDPSLPPDVFVTALGHEYEHYKIGSSSTRSEVEALIVSTALLQEHGLSWLYPHHRNLFDFVTGQ